MFLSSHFATATRGICGMCGDGLFFQITHEKLQGDVVHEDVIQWDNAQLAKVGCQLQGVHLLHPGKQKNREN